MTVRASSLAALVAAATFLGCSQERSDPTPPPPATPRVEIVAFAPSVVANTANTVALGVIDTGGATVTVATSLGTFDPGGSTTIVSGGSGTVSLRACNGCSGTAVVTATSTNGSDVASVQMLPLAQACLTNCSVDTGCAGLACSVSGGGAGTCSATTCVATPACVPSAGTETSCSGTIDEDCDGDVGCADSDCAGAACGGGPTFYCQAERCTDVTSGLAVTVTPARTRLPANGTTTTAVEVEVTADAEALASVAVSVATSFGTITPASAVTGADGKARFTFGQTSTNAGVATITATLVAAPTVSGTATITLPRLATLQIVEEDPGSALYEVMGVAGSGWREYGWIQVKAIADDGLAYPDDLAVTFEHRSLGGSTFAPPLAAGTASCAAPECFRYQGLVASTDQPDTSGLANAWVYPGTLAGTLSFTATATAGGVTRSVPLPTIAVVGAKASGSAFSIVCSPRNLPALAETDCSISLVDAPFTCEALLKDRFGNVLGRQTQVYFRSEAATVGQVVWTPEYKGELGPDMELGVALQGFTTLGAGLPFDVTPDLAAGEPSVSHDLDGCGLPEHNPRDGVVTLIAIADGEETFFDANGNGSVDAGEPFVDQGEPFVDQNDNGLWDSGEWFLDVDRSSDYTPANGAWDANTKIWTQTVVVYTGTPVNLVSGGFLGTRISAAGVDACTPTPALPAAPSFDIDVATTVAPAESVSYWLYASDMNLNFLHAGTSYEVATRGAGSVDVQYWGFDSYADDIGMSYTYQPCDTGVAGTCAAQCQATGGTICEMVPSLTNFSCGLDGARVDLTAGSAGPVYLDWAVQTPWNRYGSAAFRRTVRTASGVVRAAP